MRAQGAVLLFVCTCALLSITSLRTSRNPTPMLESVPRQVNERPSEEEQGVPVPPPVTPLPSPTTPIPPPVTPVPPPATPVPPPVTPVPPPATPVPPPVTSLPEEPQPQPQPQPQPEPQQQPKPLCKRMRDLYPGTLVGKHWEPDNCRIEKFSEEESFACLRESPWLGIGDSLVQRSAFQWLFRWWKLKPETLPNSEWPPAMRKLWSPSVMHFVRTRLAQLSVQEMDVLPYIRDEVKVVFFSQALWDMGWLWCGTDQYFMNYRDKVLSYKAMIRADRRADVQLVLLGLPYLHLGQVALVKTCNPMRKIEVYREIILQVASCLGVGVFDYYELQKIALERGVTKDGLHLEGNGLHAMMEMMQNVGCGAKLNVTYHSMPCDPVSLAKTMQRWREDAVANSASPGCKETQPHAADSVVCTEGSLHNFTKYEAVGGPLSEADRTAGRLPSEVNWYKDPPKELPVNIPYLKKP